MLFKGTLHLLEGKHFSTCQNLMNSMLFMNGIEARIEEYITNLNASILLLYFSADFFIWSLSFDIILLISSWSLMRVERKRSARRNTTWLSVADLGVSHVTRARLESTVVTDLMIVSHVNH